MLTVSTSPDFAAKWLVQRLGRFAENHREIDFRVSATLHHVDFTKEDVDVAVRHGDGRWLGPDAVRLSNEEQLSAVCSPRGLGAGGRKFSLLGLLKIPLLHLDDHYPWWAWFEAAGMALAKPRHGPTFNRASMLLVRPFPVSMPLPQTYWIVGPVAASKLAKIETFRAWLMAEAAEDRRRVEALGG